ncbi:MAG: type II toxin-antitoxin system RelE/ParE family toxin [Oscillospiraceae bacterium]|nr:type II toxin-antitoxin system RelE/ParE family toxin [Oscillospiraceae bacterium]
MVINYSKQAIKFLSRQDRPTKERIVDAINKLPAGDVKKYQGTNSRYRLRVGDFRVIFDKQDNILYIEKIGSRGDVYK